jgi:hypothetical protein
MSGGYQNGGQYLLQRWSSYSLFAANVLGPSNYLGFTAYPWMKVNVAGGTITFSVSPDGVNWWDLGIEALSSYITSIDEVGFGVFSAGTEAGTCILQSFEIS